MSLLQQPKPEYLAWRQRVIESNPERAAEGLGSVIVYGSLGLLNGPLDAFYHALINVSGCVKDLKDAVESGNSNIVVARISNIVSMMAVVTATFVGMKTIFDKIKDKLNSKPKQTQQ